MNATAKRVLLGALGVVLAGVVILLSIPFSRAVYKGYSEAADKRALGTKSEPAR